MGQISAYLLLALAAWWSTSEQPAFSCNDPETERAALRSLQLEVFVAETWLAPEDGEASTVSLGLRFVNGGEAPVVVDLFDTLRFTCFAADGEVIPFGFERTKTLIPDPIRIEGGKSVEIRWEGKLYHELGQTREYGFSFEDETGGYWILRNLRTGKYDLRVAYMGAVRSQVAWAWFFISQPD